MLPFITRSFMIGVVCHLAPTYAHPPASQPITLSSHNQQGVNEAFFEAIKDGDVSHMAYLLAAGADVNARNKKGDTALVFAVKKGTIDMVKILIEKGADVNARDTKGDSALIHAIEKEDWLSMQCLLAAGADVNACDDEGASALGMTIRHGTVDDVKALIEKGADIHACHEEGDSALGIAAQYGKLEIVKMLIEKGADVNGLNEYGRSALMLAVKNVAPLEVVKFLIDKGANVRAMDKHSETALIHAADVQMDTLCVRALGFPLYDYMIITQFNTGETLHNDFKKVLHVKKEWEASVEALIQAGCDVNARSVFGRSALHCAVNRGNHTIIKLLLEAGSDVNMRNENRMTPLMIAARNCTRLTQNNLGTFPLMTIIRSGGINENVVEALFSRLNPTNQEDADSGSDAYDSDSDSDSDFVDEDLMRLLHEANENGQMLVRMLIRHGADVNASNEEGATALKLAKKNENKGITEILIEAGAKH